MSFRRWYVRRTLQLIPTLFGITIISFVLVRLIPGDPAIIMLGHQYTPQLYQRARMELGLNYPIYVQYLFYLKLLITGNWGTSFVNSAPVFPLVLGRFVNTLSLTILAMLEASVAGIALGIIAATHRGSKIDTMLTRYLGIAGMSFPVFWVALLFILAFSVDLRLFPAVGGGGIQFIILPSLSLAVFAFGLISRVTRSSLLDVMSEDYAITAKAKGLKRGRILLNHVLRNAWISIITITGLQFGALVGGAVITETVFAYPGLGLLLVTAVERRDYPVIQASILVAGIAIALTNLLVDYLYAYVDPRVRYGST